MASTGTEVIIAVGVAKALAAEGISVRVVSMPCCELFDQQPLEYQMSVFPDGVPVMSIEASASQGWHRYAHVPYGMQTFGASAPYERVYEKFGFTEANLTAKAKEVVAFFENRPVLSRVSLPR